MGTSVEVIVMAAYKHINPKYLNMYQDIPVLIRLLEFDMMISLDNFEFTWRHVVNSEI